MGVGGVNCQTWLPFNLFDVSTLALIQHSTSRTFTFSVMLLGAQRSPQDLMHLLAERQALIFCCHLTLTLSICSPSVQSGLTSDQIKGTERTGGAKRESHERSSQWALSSHYFKWKDHNTSPDLGQALSALTPRNFHCAPWGALFELQTVLWYSRLWELSPVLFFKKRFCCMNFKFFIFILSAFPSSIVGAAAAKTSSHIASFWLTCSSQFVSWLQALISGSAGHVVLAWLLCTTTTIQLWLKVQYNTWLMFVHWFNPSFLYLTTFIFFASAIVIVLSVFHEYSGCLPSLRDSYQ